jgi:hypothetical protein
MLLVRDIDAYYSNGAKKTCRKSCCKYQTKGLPENVVLAIIPVIILVAV